MKLRLKLTGGYAVILALMTTASIVVYFSIHSLIESSRWVNHTYDVIINAKNVSGAMVDMETGQRGFVIAGKDTFLEPFNNGQHVFDDLIDNGKKLTSDNPKQVTRWQAVADLKARWLSEAANPEINARKEVSKGAQATTNFEQISSRTVGKDIFDSIRAKLSNINSKLANNPEGLHLVTLITLDLVNMETGQRGYLLSGQEVSLDPYKQGQQSLSQNLLALESKIRGTRVSPSDLEDVKNRVDMWIEKAAAPEIAASDISIFLSISFAMIIPLTS